MTRRLKVFRTPIGFHDAYVAAPSQKAALEAWGSDKNLFARGDAEEVTDAKLMREPLAHPGEIIRRARGTAAEHLATVSKGSGKRVKPSSNARPAHAKKQTKPARPSRDKLDAAERALDEARAEHGSAIEELKRQERELARERHGLETRLAGKIEKLEATRAKAAAAFENKIDEWRAKVDALD